MVGLLVSQTPGLALTTVRGKGFNARPWPMDKRGSTSAERPVSGLVPFPQRTLGRCARRAGMYLTAHDDGWRKITVQTSPTLGNIASKFRRSPAGRLGGTQRVGRGLVDVMSRIHGA